MRTTHRFIVIAAGILFWAIQPTTAWAQFVTLGGIIVENPACASAGDGTGQIICAAKGYDNSLFGIRFNPSTGVTTGFQSLGGIIVDDPSCATAGGGAICAVKGYDNSLFGIFIRP